MLVLFSFTRCQNNNQMENLTKPVTSEKFEQLSKVAYEYLYAIQDSIKQKYALNDYEQWYYDQNRGVIEFSDSGIAKLSIKYEEVGSISMLSDTWLWAWANPHLLDQIKSRIGKVKTYGESEELEALTKGKWYGDEVDGWEMTAIAAYLLKAKGAYRVPTENTISYMLFMEIEDLRDKE